MSKKKSTYSLEKLLQTLKQNQLIKINSKNIPLFFGTIFEFNKLSDFEYKGLSIINIHMLTIDFDKDKPYFNITLDLYINFNKFSNISPQSD